MCIRDREHTILFNLEKEQEFSSGSRNQVSKLSRDISEKIGFRVTANQSSQKYRNLLFTYRTNKQRANTTGTGNGPTLKSWILCWEPRRQRIPPQFSGLLSRYNLKMTILKMWMIHNQSPQLASRARQQRIKYYEIKGALS